MTTSNSMRVNPGFPEKGFALVWLILQVRFYLLLVRFRATPQSVKIPEEHEHVKS